MSADIELTDVRKVYRKGRIDIPVLDGLNLQIAGSEFVAIMGPSGSGKSTLLHLMGGLDVPTAGAVRVGEAHLEAMTERELTAWRSRHVGFIFQMYHLVPVLTAAQNVELPLLLFRMPAAQRRERVVTALEIVGLADRMDHRPNQLSGGQEQRVAIARAIVTDPDVILADEPTGDLDARTSEEILRLLNLLNTEFGKTILMVTHDPKAAAHAARLLHLDKGVLERDVTNRRARPEEMSIPARSEEAVVGDHPWGASAFGSDAAGSAAKEASSTPGAGRNRREDNGPGK